MKKELKMEIEKEEKNKQCVGVDFYLTQQSLHILENLTSAVILGNLIS